MDKAELFKQMAILARRKGALILSYLPQSSKTGRGEPGPQPMGPVIPQLQQTAIKHPLNDSPRLWFALVRTGRPPLHQDAGVQPRRLAEADHELVADQGSLLCA
ncbi:hypothetical protein TSO5_15450 [Azospirillum sp. TSO5]|nr:hypothetical protein TSO5_15450 [Azospirillum sp. TSO5]